MSTIFVIQTLLQDKGKQIKKKSSDDSSRTADVDLILSTVNMIDATIESASAIKVVIILFLLVCICLIWLYLIKFKTNDF